MGGLHFVRIISHFQYRESPVGVSPAQQAVIMGVCPKEGSNLVDSASSHKLVSKIKSCMYKYKYYTVKLRMAHYISYNLYMIVPYYLDKRSNSIANTCINTQPHRRVVFIR